MKFKTGDLVVTRIADIHDVNVDWAEVEARHVGKVIEQTPYKVHVRWANGDEVAHNSDILLKVTGEYDENW